MEHRLEAELTLSGGLPSTVRPDELIPRIASEAVAHTIGARGQGRLAEWKLEGEQLRIVLESTGPRPHQALLAFVRRLSEELGRTARVGVRSFVAVRYRTEFSLDAAPKAAITLPIPHHLTVDGTLATLSLTTLPEEGLRDNWMDRAVALVQEKARRQTYEGKEQFWSLLSSSPPGSPSSGTTRRRRC